MRLAVDAARTTNRKMRMKNIRQLIFVGFGSVRFLFHALAHYKRTIWPNVSEWVYGSKREREWVRLQLSTSLTTVTQWNGIEALAVDVLVRSMCEYHTGTHRHTFPISPFNIYDDVIDGNHFRTSYLCNRSMNRVTKIAPENYQSEKLEWIWFRQTGCTAVRPHLTIETTSCDMTHRKLLNEKLNESTWNWYDYACSDTMCYRFACITRTLTMFSALIKSMGWLVGVQCAMCDW